MQTTRPIQWAAIAAGLITATATNARALTFFWTDTNTNTTYTIVEADPFYSGGNAGNTVRIDNAALHWAVASESWFTGANSIWSHRNAYGHDFNVLGGAAAGDRDLFESGGTSTHTPPDLRTTVSGLPNGVYEVFLVQGVRNNSGASFDNHQFLRADIETFLQTTPTTNRKRTDAGVVWTGEGGSGGNSQFEFVLNPLGEITGTDFSVLVGRGTFAATNNPERYQFVGVAYRFVAAVPEPSTLAMGLMGVVGLLAVGIRRRGGRTSP